MISHSHPPDTIIFWYFFEKFFVWWILKFVGCFWEDIWWFKDVYKEHRACQAVTFAVCTLLRFWKFNLKLQKAQERLKNEQKWTKRAPNARKGATDSTWAFATHKTFHFLNLFANSGNHFHSWTFPTIVNSNFHT